MRYRLADHVDLGDLCDQPLRLQKILDRNGNTIILAIGDDRSAVILAYSVKGRAKPAPVAVSAVTPGLSAE